MIKLEYIQEPKLQFGEYFEHEDSKTGLAEFGPFGKNLPGLHRSEIKLGFVGTGESMDGAKEWIVECGSFIESENIKKIKPASVREEGPRLFEAEEVPDPTFKRVFKILNRDFVGFSRDTKWASEFQLNQRWDRELRPLDLKRVLDLEDKEQRIKELVTLLSEEIKSIAQTSPAPDIIVVAITDDMEKKADAVRVGGNFYMNFRRAIKALAMKWGKPIQIIRRSTITGRGELQEKATRAWNFCTAMYYKADAVPWRLIGLDEDTCFVGIDFYLAPVDGGKVEMRSSVAQAFDHLGQGVVLRGDPFDWDADKYGQSPHMTTKNSSALIRATLEAYVGVRKSPPRRVVIHKSSRYWGIDHPDFNELQGLQEGIESVAPRCFTDFLTLRQGGNRLFRQGQYPPARGTFISLAGKRHSIYTMGYIPYLETYPGSYVPEPWEIEEHHGGSSPKELLREVLALTKMNVNNCSYADGVPITLSFSSKVGEVMKHIPQGELAETGYKFYM